MRDDTKMHYCERCGTYRKIFNLEIMDVCQKCGNDLDEELEIEEWRERCRNYLELIKMLSEFYETYSDQIPFESVKAKIKILNDYVLDNHFDRRAATDALNNISEILTEED